MLVIDVADTYLSPFVSKKYCLYFYLLSFFFGVSLLITLFVGIFTYILNYKKINLGSMVVANWALFIMNCFFGYFINRLFYSMCVRSLT